MQAASPSPSDKTSWRRHFRNLLRETPDPTAESEKICRHLASEFASLNGHRIATFAALPGETNLRRLVSELPDIEWGYPRVIDQDLSFHRVQDFADLRPGAMSIWEPSTELPWMPPSSFDVILCPGLGFGLDGSRLGRGRGYYDRTLEVCGKDTRVIGIALSHQVVASLPVEPHDRFMDEIVTADGFLKPSVG